MRKLSIFDFAKKITNGDTKFIDTLTEEELKQFNPYMIVQLMKRARSNNNIHVYMTDLICGKYFLSLSDHPKLLYKALALSNEDPGLWFDKIKKTETFDKPLTVSVIQEYLKYGYEDSKDVVKLFEESDILEMCFELNKDKKFINDIRKEFL